MNGFLNGVMWYAFCRWLAKTIADTVSDVQYARKKQAFDKEIAAISERIRKATTWEERIKAVDEMEACGDRYWP